MNSFFKKIEKDVWIIFLLVFISTYNIFNLKHWNEEDRVIIWDVVSYYGYLPATFIYGDVTLENPNDYYQKYDHTFWYNKTDEGVKVFKVSIGMAILYSPFFFISHLYTIATDGVASGFSPPYKFAICMSSLFYFLIGLIFLRKLLRYFYSENAVALTLLIIGIGTNLYYYVVIAVGYPHNYLFCLLAIIAYLIIKWYEKPNFKLSVILGILFGLMVLVRPTMLIVSLFALLYRIYSLDMLMERLRFYKKHFSQLFTVLLFAFIIWIPQFIYWKISIGDFLYYSYSEEGFFFSDPQFLNALFSFRKGWLIYTPLMFFALVGLAMMFKKKEKIAIPISVTVVIYFYVATCWWDWWFGGSFGYRTMIDMLPLLAFGLAYFIQQMLKYKKVYKFSTLSFLFLLLAFNLFQTRQAHEGLIHHDSMTKKAYFKILFKLQSQISRDEVKPFLKAPDYNKAKKGERDQ
jgi:hypothetical protein